MLCRDICLDINIPPAIPHAFTPVRPVNSPPSRRHLSTPPEPLALAARHHVRSPYRWKPTCPRPGGHVRKRTRTQHLLSTCGPHPGRPDAALQQTQSWVKVGTVVRCPGARSAPTKKMGYCKTYSFGPALRIQGFELCPYS